MELSVYDSIENGIRERFGSDVSVIGKNRVGGGDINDAFVRNNFIYRIGQIRVYT